jgi:hypothetical protein
VDPRLNLVEPWKFPLPIVITYKYNQVEMFLEFHFCETTLPLYIFSIHPHSLVRILNTIMPQLDPLAGTDYYLWKYLPSLVGAVVFLSLFTTTTIPLCWRICKTRSWFCIAFAVGGSCKSKHSRIVSSLHGRSISLTCPGNCTNIAQFKSSATQSAFSLTGEPIRSPHTSFSPCS